MPVNNGIIEMTCKGGAVVARIFYDSSVAFDPPNQAIVEQGTPPAACLVVNNSGVTVPVTVTGPTGKTLPTPDVPPGTTRVRLAQLQAIGINTRADVAGFELGC